MLSELMVSDLGVIEQVTLLFGSGMTALTGETGAGKTLLIEAIQLLLGSRADPMLVRPGAEEARVDGRFATDEGETVLTRVVPAEGRSRAYVDGRPVPANVLAELGRSLVDLHGQHAHQSLLGSSAQREALDAFARTDLGPLDAARRHVIEVTAALGALGGDARARAREIDLLQFQLAEINTAAIEDRHEEHKLAFEEDELADAVAHRDAATAVLEALTGERGARDALAAGLGWLRDRRPFAEGKARLTSVLADLDDIAADLRSVADGLEDDPERLAAVRSRRNALRDLRRKYGDDLDAVLAFRDEARRRLHELNAHDETAQSLERALADAVTANRNAAADVRAQRAAAAPKLAKDIERRLRALAMPNAIVEIAVGEADQGNPGDVVFLLSANRGSAPQPLSKVASGGELSRAMLATSLALLSTRRSGPETLVFDEVDAGVGGAAAVAVGEALAALGVSRQVLVVTHLAQVAAVAGGQILVAKTDRKRATRTSTTRIDGEARVRELSRMLSGQPESETARRHAEELLVTGRPSVSRAG